MSFLKKGKRVINPMIINYLQDHEVDLRQIF